MYRKQMEETEQWTKLCKSNGKGIMGQKERTVIHMRDYLFQTFSFPCASPTRSCWLMIIPQPLLGVSGGQRVHRGHVSAFFSCIFDFFSCVSHALAFQHRESAIAFQNRKCTNLPNTALFCLLVCFSVLQNLASDIDKAL